MTLPSSSSSLPPDCLRSFDRASHAEPMKRCQNLIIASRILGNILEAGGHTLEVLDLSEDFPLDTAWEIFGDSLRVTDFHGAIDMLDYRAGLHEFTQLFTKAEEILDFRMKNYPDIPLAGLFSARIGKAFAASLMDEGRQAPDKSYRFYKHNPFLMINVAAEMLQSINRQLDGRHHDGHDRRHYFWEETTHLYRDLKNYCHEIHSIYPENQEAHLVSRETLVTILTELHYMNAMIVRSNQGKFYMQENFPAEKQAFDIVRKYISPLVETPVHGSLKPREGIILEWDVWAQKAIVENARRAQHHAAHPELFFPDKPPIR